MIVTTWSNGTPNRETGSGFGLKVRKGDRDLFFSRQYSEVEVQMEGVEQPAVVNIDKASFWGECSELISSRIGMWLIENELDSWDDREPHPLQLDYAGGNRFNLYLP